jgi:hypothetical protein
VFCRKKPQFQMTLDQCLVAAIVRNPQAQEKDLPERRIELSLPYRKPWVVRVFSRKDRKTFLRRFELDEIGADLWRLADDKRTVAELVAHLARTQHLDPQQAQTSMISYVHMLMTRGLVGLVVQQ